MNLVRESIACIGSGLQEMKSERSQAFLVRHLSTDSPGGSSSTFGERPAGIMQHIQYQSRVPVLEALPPQEPVPRLALKPVQSVSEEGRDPFYKLPVEEPETFPSRLMSRSKRKTPLASFQQVTYMTALANVHYQSRTMNLQAVFEGDCNTVNRQLQVETSISIHPKPWLLGRGFALSYSISGNSWRPQFGFQLRHYNIRSEEALIFEFCSFGDIEGVKSPLRRGEASPFDCDPEGCHLYMCALSKIS